MKLGVLLVALVLSGQGFAKGEDKPIRVDRLCGFLMQEREVPPKRAGQSAEKADFALGKFTVRLYLRTGDGTCCGREAPISEVMTRRSGKFEFKKIRAGSYWIVSSIDGKQYSVAVDYEPVRGRESGCEEFLYVASLSGKFIMKAIITVT